MRMSGISAWFNLGTDHQPAGIVIAAAGNRIDDGNRVDQRITIILEPNDLGGENATELVPGQLPGYIHRPRTPRAWLHEQPDRQNTGWGVWPIPSSRPVAEPRFRGEVDGTIGGNAGLQVLSSGRWKHSPVKFYMLCFR